MGKGKEQIKFMLRWKNKTEKGPAEKEDKILSADPEKTEGNIVRKKLIFKGEVQFVGFRFQSKYIADMLGLTGYVENLPDGAVLMEVQGRLETIQEMILCLHQKKPIRIDSVEEEDLPLKKKEKGFRYMW